MSESFMAGFFSFNVVLEPSKSEDYISTICKLFPTSCCTVLAQLSYTLQVTCNDLHEIHLKIYYMKYILKYIIYSLNQENLSVFFFLGILMPEQRARDTVRCSDFPRMRNQMGTRTVLFGLHSTKCIFWVRCLFLQTTFALLVKKRTCAALLSLFER